MKTLLIATSLLALTACGTTQHTAMKSDNGNHMYTMDCSGFNHSLGVCMDKAQTLCAEGFSIVKIKRIPLSIQPAQMVFTNIQHVL